MEKIRLKANRKITLGKQEPEGQILKWEEGEVKEYPYYEILDRYIDAGILEKVEQEEETEQEPEQEEKQEQDEGLVNKLKQIKGVGKQTVRKIMANANTKQEVKQFLQETDKINYRRKEQILDKL